MEWEMIYELINPALAVVVATCWVRNRIWCMYSVS